MQTFSVIANTLATTDATQPVKLAKNEFNLLLQELRPAILRYCQRYLRNIDDAEEACQDTLLKALLGYEKFEGRASVKSWLYSIASNVCASQYQQRNRSQLFEDLDNLTEEPECTSRPESETGPLFSDLITRLSVQERTVLSFRFLEDLQLPEIATCLDLNISTVKMCYYRALDKCQLAEAS